MLSHLPRDVFDEIWDLIESVSEGFSTYFFNGRFTAMSPRFRTYKTDDIPCEMTIVTALFPF